MAASNRCWSKSSIFETYVYLDEYVLHIIPYFTDLLIKYSYKCIYFMFNFSIKWKLEFFYTRNRANGSHTTKHMLNALKSILIDEKWKLKLKSKRSNRFFRILTLCCIIHSFSFLVHFKKICKILVAIQAFSTFCLSALLDFSAVS